MDSKMITTLARIQFKLEEFACKLENAGYKDLAAQCDELAYRVDQEAWSLEIDRDAA